MTDAKLCALWFATGLVLTAPPALAGRLTLDDALERALERNERMAIARENINEAQVRLSAAWLQLLPALSATASVRVNDREVRFNDRVVQERWGTTGNASARLTLFEPSTIPGILEAEEALDVERASARFERFDLLYAVTEAYLAVAVAQNAVLAAERSLTTARETRTITAARVAAGLALPIDELRAELAVTQADASSIRARTVLDDARAFLAFLAGEADPPVAVDEPRVIENRLQPPSATRRPDLQLLDASLVLARTSSDLDWLELMPTLSVVGSYVAASDGGFTNQTERSWLQVALGWTLFEIGDTWEEATVNAADVRRAELELALAERRAGYENGAAEQRLVAVRSSLDVAEKRLALAEASRAQLVKTYEAGRASALDLLEAEDELRAAELGVTAEQLNLALTQVSLMRARGVDPRGSAGAPEKP
jgi:outer membrane protein TolC